jgi:hypothetical protein
VNLTHFLTHPGDASGVVIALFIAIGFLNFFFGDLDADEAYHQLNEEEDWLNNPTNPLSHNFERDD